MSNLILYFLSPVFIGIGATLTFDLWALFLKSVFKIVPSNFCLLGRWILYMPEGIFRHATILTTPQKNGECTVGWISHYMTGIVFAVGFIAFVGRDWLQHPNFMEALFFGIVTVLASFFLLHPAFGFGVAASRTSNAAQARVRSLTNHAVFGFGLYLFGLLVNSLIKVLA